MQSKRCVAWACSRNEDGAGTSPHADAGARAPPHCPAPGSLTQGRLGPSHGGGNR